MEWKGSSLNLDMVSCFAGLSAVSTQKLNHLIRVVVFVDTPQLSADSLVYLTSEKRNWLAGRYVNSFWDLPQLMAKKDEIVSGDKLKVRLVV